MAAKVKSKVKQKVEPSTNGTPPLRLEWLDADTLTDNPANWRLHPAPQTDALRDVLAEVGWAGALLYNERTQRLVDGHLRKKVAAGQRVPVLIGSWTEEQERKILATLDPIAALATADKDKLDALLRDVQTGSEALAGMLAELASKAGMFAANEIGMPALANGDKAPFQQMTFTLHDTQADTVKRAVDKAKGDGGDKSAVNENSNGNALAVLAGAYLGER